MTATPTDQLTRLKSAISAVYRGSPGNIDRLLTGLIGAGHVLLEDIPGVGKTTLAKTVARALGLDFHRLQGTPDLLPADILGVSIWNEEAGRFQFQRGPIFCDILLADELNRSPPRTQAALLEAMSEEQVTADGTTHALSDTFFCIATQNPTESAGTYPLPDSQLDRFMLSTRLGYPEVEDEMKLLESGGVEDSLAELGQVASREDLVSWRRACREVRVEDDVRRYLFAAVSSTRTHPRVTRGASPRAALGFQRACQAWALLQGRSFVIPEDIQDLAPDCLAHRISCRGRDSTSAVVDEIISDIDVPR